MKKITKLRSDLAFNIIGATVLLLLVFSWIVSIIGYVSFTNAFKREYNDSTFHMADTATALVNGDSLDYYLTYGENEEYLKAKEHLDVYCNKMNVSLIYVIKVDTSDYGRFVSIFNSVNNDVGNTNYSPWELGHKRDTTNDEYRNKYKAIYENNSSYETIYRIHTKDGLHPHITTLVPVKNSKGEVISILCIQRPISELNRARRPYLINIAISTIILSVLVGLSSALYIRRELINPLRKITNETIRFAKENKKGDKLGLVSKIEEISSLAESIDTMENDMLNYIENLTAVTSEKERIGAELSIAKTIQENSVPNIFPPFPERTEFDVFALMIPAKEVGGDFYNFFLIDDDHLALTIADVSGKGIPAALFMMVTNILISDRAHMGGTPSEILNFVNDNICQHNRAQMFVTVWLGILEISTGKMIAANAGHDDVAVYRKNGEFELLKTKHGLVIGAMEGVKYKDFEFTLSAYDKLFLYTDGVPEATNKHNNMFTLDGMIKALNKHKDKQARDVILGVKDAVDEFVDDAPQFDDLTMVCLEMKETENKNTLIVDAKTDNLQEVLDFVDKVLDENDCPQKAQMQIDLSVEEMFVNVAKYAYKDGVGKVEINTTCNSGEITIVLKDSGIRYNPLEKEDPDTSLSSDERQIGGLGIFLTKKNMDEVYYDYKNNQNVFTMKKSIK